MKKRVIDSSGNEIECFTLGNAAKYLGIPKEQLKLQLFKEHLIPFYKVMGRSGKRVIRIKKKDLDEFVVDQEMYNRIADKIKQAREEHVVVKTGISQQALSDELKVSRVHINYVENKKKRVGIKRLNQIAKFFDKDLAWFLQ